MAGTNRMRVRERALRQSAFPTLLMSSLLLRLSVVDMPALSAQNTTMRFMSSTAEGSTAEGGTARTGAAAAASTLEWAA